MAISIAPPNLGGLAARSGQGSLSLPNMGAMGLQSIQAQRALEQQAAMEQARIRSRDEAMLKSGLLANRRMDITENQNLQNNQYQQGLLGIQQQKLAADQQNQQGMMDYRNRGLDMEQQKLAAGQQDNQQKLAFEQMKVGIDELAKKDKKELNEMGSFAAAARSAMDQVKDPMEANMLRNQIVDEAMQKGYLPAKQAKSLKQLPISAFNRATEMMMFQADKAKEYQAMKKANAPEKASSGSQLEFYPDGTVKSVSQGLTKPNVNKQQDKALNIEKQLSGLDSLEKELDERYLTYKGQATAGMTKLEEKAKGIPILETALSTGADVVSGMDKKERKEYLGKMQSFANQTFQVFQDYRMLTTGMQAAYAELNEIQDKYLSSEMSFTQYVGAIKGLKSKYKRDLEIVKKQLRTGVDVTPDVSKMSEAELDAAIAAAQGNK